MIDSITYYDRSTLIYMSPFVKGLALLAKKDGFRFQVSKFLPDFMHKAEFRVAKSFIDRTDFGTSAEIALNCTGLFRARLTSGDDFYFCIDAGDHSEFSHTIDGIYYGYHIPLLEKVRFYFKVNFSKKALDRACMQAEESGKVRALPVVYPTPIPSFWNYLPGCFPVSKFARHHGFEVRRIKDLVNLFAMGKLARFRSATKFLDVFFVVNYYENPVHRSENEFRLELIAKFRESGGLKLVTGFASNQPLPSLYERYRVNRYRMTTYMRMLAHARVAVYCRGVHDCLSFKLGSYLEMGLPIVGQRLQNNEEFYSAHDSVWSQFSYDNPDEIVAAVKDAVRQPTMLARMAKTNGTFFDTHLSPDSLARQIGNALIGGDS